MTSNQISWWNIQESIRSHQQNELNERNKQSITSSLGEEQNRISANKVKNDFILGQQNNAINQQQADTASRRATQDYDIGSKTVANQSIRNKNDYEVGSISNANKAREISNNYIVGQGGVNNQSIRNAQDYALGKLQQNSNARQADAALLSASAQFGKLNPAQIVVALAAPTAQKLVDKTVKKVSKAIQNQTATSKSPGQATKGSVNTSLSLNAAQKAIVNSPRSGIVPKPVKKVTVEKVVETKKPKSNKTGRY